MSRGKFPVQRGLGRYLIAVGEALNEFSYDSDVVYDNVGYFWDMYNSGVSPYRSLELLNDYLNKKNAEESK